MYKVLGRVCTACGNASHCKFLSVLKHSKLVDWHGNPPLVSLPLTSYVLFLRHSVIPINFTHSFIWRATFLGFSQKWPTIKILMLFTVCCPYSIHTCSYSLSLSWLLSSMNVVKHCCTCCVLTLLKHFCFFHLQKHRKHMNELACDYPLGMSID